MRVSTRWSGPSGPPVSAARKLALQVRAATLEAMLDRLIAHFTAAEDYNSNRPICLEELYASL